MLAVLFSAIICVEGLGMSDDEFLDFYYAANNVGDVFYLSLVMMNGLSNNEYLSELGITNKNSFYMCKSFTSKYICELVAKYYSANEITGVNGTNLSEKYLAQEIYAHAIVFYYVEDVLKIIDTLDNDLNNIYPGYNLMKPLFTHIIGHANPINLGGNGSFDKLGVNLFPLIWDYF